jgi:hypothetical protein
MLHSALQYLHRNQIDTARWDQCIANAPNGLLYAYSFYLDHMSPQWDALVLGDYEAVMPLTWRKKFGISYLYQPFVTVPLGVFSSGPIDQALMETFIDHIPGKFKLIEIYLNTANNCFNSPFIEPRRNYVLPLTGSYESIEQHYNRHARRKLKKASEARLQVAEGAVRPAHERGGKDNQQRVGFRCDMVYLGVVELEAEKRFRCVGCGHGCPCWVRCCARVVITTPVATTSAPSQVRPP